MTEWEEPYDFSTGDYITEERIDSYRNAILWLKQNMGGLNWMGYYISGRWYRGVHLAGYAASSSFTSNTIYAFPFFTAIASTWDRIGTYITYGGTGLARLGVYGDTGSVYPGALILDSGELTVPSSGVLQATINLSLDPGLYWLVLLSDSNLTLSGHDGRYHYGIFGSSSPEVAGSSCYAVSHSYGALPSTFPSGATPDIRALVIALRKA